MVFPSPWRLHAEADLPADPDRREQDGRRARRGCRAPPARAACRWWSTRRHLHDPRRAASGSCAARAGAAPAPAGRREAPTRDAATPARQPHAHHEHAGDHHARAPRARSASSSLSGVRGRRSAGRAARAAGGRLPFGPRRGLRRGARLRGGPATLPRRAPSRCLGGRVVGGGRVPTRRRRARTAAPSARPPTRRGRRIPRRSPRTRGDVGDRRRRRAGRDDHQRLAGLLRLDEPARGVAVEVEPLRRQSDDRRRTTARCSAARPTGHRAPGAHPRAGSPPRAAPSGGSRGAPKGRWRTCRWARRRGRSPAAAGRCGSATRRTRTRPRSRRRPRGSTRRGAAARPRSSPRGPCGGRARRPGAPPTTRPRRPTAHRGPSGPRRSSPPRRRGRGGTRGGAREGRGRRSRVARRRGGTLDDEEGAAQGSPGGLRLIAGPEGTEHDAPAVAFRARRHELDQLVRRGEPRPPGRGRRPRSADAETCTQMRAIVSAARRGPQLLRLGGGAVTWRRRGREPPRAGPAPAPRPAPAGGAPPPRPRGAQAPTNQ